MLIRQPIDRAIFQMIEEQQLTGKTGNPKNEDAHLEPGEIDVAVRLGVADDPDRRQGSRSDAPSGGPDADPRVRSTALPEKPLRDGGVPPRAEAAPGARFSSPRS